MFNHLLSPQTEGSRKSMNPRQTVLYLLYKISNKKIFSLLYGINPFILIEAIAHVHNDIFIIFFTLLAIILIFIILLLRQDSIRKGIFPSIFEE